MTSAYCMQSQSDLVRSEEAILSRRYESRAALDLDFFGHPLDPTGKSREIEDWIQSEVQRRLNALSQSAGGRMRRHWARFPKAAFRADLLQRFGAAGGLTLFMVLYYLAVAIYWWRQLK